MGTDLNQTIPDYGNFFLGDTIVKLVKKGEVSESVIDEKVRRILRLIFRSGSFKKKSGGSFATLQHFAVARKVAEEGIVLLKNTQHILPFSKIIRSVAVIGTNEVTEMSNAGATWFISTHLVGKKQAYFTSTQCLLFHLSFQESKSCSISLQEFTLVCLPGLASMLCGWVNNKVSPLKISRFLK